MTETLTSMQRSDSVLLWEYRWVQRLCWNVRWNLSTHILLRSHNTFSKRCSDLSPSSRIDPTGSWRVNWITGLQNDVGLIWVMMETLGDFSASIPLNKFVFLMSVWLTHSIMCSVSPTLALQCKSDVDHIRRPRSSQSSRWREINKRSQRAAVSQVHLEELCLTTYKTQVRDSSAGSLFSVRHGSDTFKDHSAT